MLFRKHKTESRIDPELNLRSFRFLGTEAETLGLRLDAARHSLTEAKSPWALHYWSMVVDQLLAQWQRLPVLHDGDARMSVVPRWTVDYDFYELQQEGNLYGVSDRFYDTVFKKDANLNDSWERNRERRLAKAQ
jgi:hypothetical protein